MIGVEIYAANEREREQIDPASDVCMLIVVSGKNRLCVGWGDDYGTFHKLNGASHVWPEKHDSEELKAACEKLLEAVGDFMAVQR